MAVKANDQTVGRVFISYDHRDEDVARQLYDLLLAAGFDVWRDKENIRLGRRWPDELSKAIRNVQFFVACVSANYCEKLRSNKNGILAQELKCALEIQQNIQLQTSFYLLLPLRIDDCQWPAELREQHYLNWDGGKGNSRLIEEMRQEIKSWEQSSIRSRPKRKSKISPALPGRPPLTRILFADTRGLLNGNRLPLVVEQDTHPGLSGVIELRDWTWQYSALGRWRVANHEEAWRELKRDGALNFDLLIFSWMADNNAEAQKLYEMARAARPELPLLVVADDDGGFPNRNEKIRDHNRLFTLFQPPSDWEGAYPDRHAPFNRSCFLEAFKALDERFLPETQARLTNHTDWQVQRLCHRLGGEQDLELTVQKFFPQAREFRLSEVEGLEAERKIWTLQVEGIENRYLLAFFENRNFYENALRQHKPAAEWLETGAAKLHLIPHLDFEDQLEAFPIGERPAHYALCYEIAAPRRNPRTFGNFYRQEGDHELGKLFGEMLKRLRSKPFGKPTEAPWHEPDRRGNCSHGFCWQQEMREQLLATLRDLELYGPAMYEALREVGTVAKILSWEQCRNELESLVYKPLPSWLTEPHAVRRGHIHGQPAFDRWLESGTAGRLQLFDFSHYEPQGRLVTDLAILERDLKLRLLATESDAGDFRDLQIDHLPLWCHAESAAIAGLLDYRHEQTNHSPTTNRAYQLIAQVRAEAKKVCAKQDTYGVHYFAALLYLTLETLKSPSVRPTKKLLALHSAAEILRTLARLYSRP